MSDEKCPMQGLIVCLNDFPPVCGHGDLNRLFYEGVIK